MTRHVVALIIVAASISSVTFAQNPPQFPQRHRNADVPALLSAAKAGDSEAMLWLGVKHHNGAGVPKDYAQAFTWYRKAADLGQSSGMFFVGLSFWNSRGVAQDLVEAYKWLDLSAKYGNQAERDRAVSARDSLARVMSPGMIEQAKAREADWEKRKRF